MSVSERARRFRAPRGPRAVAWALSLLLISLYLLLPGSEEPALGTGAPRDDGDEVDRLEIQAVAPLEPYPGSSIVVSYAGAPRGAVLAVYAAKSELPILARREGELVARLPRELDPGDLKIRLTQVHEPKLAVGARPQKSKPFHVRVKQANWRKVFRSLVGGFALIALGIALMAHGVRASTGLHAARAMTRTTERRGVAYGLGALTGAFTQSTTGAAGILAALVSSGVLAIVPAALAFLGAQLGTSITALAVTGLIEPREGLVAVAIGVLWLGLVRDRRGSAIGRLVLGAGFVALGLQTFRPGLEPFLSDPLLVSLTDQLRVDSALDVALCALLGSVLVAALQGPAPLIVLILGVAQTTGQWHLTTALALLSGTGLGAALASLLTVSSAPASRKLARLNFVLGAGSTLFAACTVVLWAALTEQLVGDYAGTLQWGRRVALSALGTPLALAFVLSQLSSALLLSLGAERLSAWLDRRKRAPLPTTLDQQQRAEAVRGALARVLGLQQTALASTTRLVETGERSFGDRAEHTLAEAHAALDGLLAGELQALMHVEESEALCGSAFACLQLQNSLETLLVQAERVTDARLDAFEQSAEALPWDDELVLRDLHLLVMEGLRVTHASLTAREPVDLDHARMREIEINRLEAHARHVLLTPEQPTHALTRHLHVLRVVDAYEVVGNQVYRLAVTLAQHCAAPSLP